MSQLHLNKPFSTLLLVQLFITSISRPTLLQMGSQLKWNNVMSLMYRFLYSYTHNYIIVKRHPHLKWMVISHSSKWVSPGKKKFNRDLAQSQNINLAACSPTSLLRSYFSVALNDNLVNNRWSFWLGWACCCGFFHTPQIIYCKDLMDH